ncbi:MAG: polynucleotide adenylyltransferase, partial [Opitutales bacterium]|nr:polynucleotide adenylyltransferase [Opitutales bacterium]
MTFSSKDACQYIATQAAALGGRAYYVGGCVRDSILGVHSKDTDVEIFGLSPEQIEKVLSKKFHFEAVGKSFGVWILKGLDIDVSMPRKERKNGLGHKSFEIIGDPNLSPKEACSRRDFTINAMLRDILSGEIIDPFDGQKDIEKKIIRHTSDKFAEDPLRVLRAMQFAARFNFDVAPKTVGLCSNIPMENLPKERVFQEFKKLILKGKKISKGLAFLRDCNWVKYFPELSAMVGCPQDPIWHPEGDVYTHTMLCMDSFA